MRIKHGSCISQCLIHEHVSFSITSKPECKKTTPKFVFLKKKNQTSFRSTLQSKYMNEIRFNSLIFESIHFIYPSMVCYSIKKKQKQKKNISPFLLVSFLFSV